MFLAAAIQMTSTSDVEGTFAQAESLIRRAAARGAKLVVTPENTNFLGPHDAKVRNAEPVTGPTIARFAALARDLDLTLIVGSFNELADDRTRCHNTTVVLAPDGSIQGSYRKVHLFDVDVSADVRFQESTTVEPGDKVVVIDTPLARIGLSICYDLRFPELYRALVDRGAEVITIPAAFTLHTGKDHWHTLIRARAIETQTWVIAPGQSGKHDDGGLRHSYGHSMIVDPWGVIVAEASDGPGLAVAEIDLDKMRAVRAAIPVCNHRRL